MNFEYIRNIVLGEHALEQQFNQNPEKPTVKLLILNQVPQSVHAKSSGFIS